MAARTRVYRVVEAHQPEVTDVLTVSEGDRLTFQRKPTEWEGWLWSSTQSGQSGWIPEAWVRIDGDTCIVLKDYCSAELSVKVGEQVVGDLVESGWARVSNSRGGAGWVPLRCLEGART